MRCRLLVESTALTSCFVMTAGAEHVQHPDEPAPDGGVPAAHARARESRPQEGGEPERDGAVVGSGRDGVHPRRGRSPGPHPEEALRQPQRGRGVQQGQQGQAESPDSRLVLPLGCRAWFNGDFTLKTPNKLILAKKVE